MSGRIRVKIPTSLRESCQRSGSGDWLATLPDVVGALCDRWRLVPGRPYPAQASWVAPATTADGIDVVLKVGMPHPEAEDEIAGLRFWDGEPTVRVLAADAELQAMVLERCEPGTPLARLPEREQEEVLADLLPRLWRPATTADGFRPLSTMLDLWAEEASAHARRWMDAPLVREGLVLFSELSCTPGRTVLLATDLHAGNVLRAERHPWLVIDPKPFVGIRPTMRPSIS